VNIGSMNLGEDCTFQKETTAQEAQAIAKQFAM